ncbi:unnamed protein product, partial [Closterium sp. NIES-54]
THETNSPAVLSPRKHQLQAARQQNENGQPTDGKPKGWQRQKQGGGEGMGVVLMHLGVMMAGAAGVAVAFRVLPGHTAPTLLSAALWAAATASLAVRPCSSSDLSPSAVLHHPWHSYFSTTAQSATQPFCLIPSPLPVHLVLLPPFPLPLRLPHLSPFPHNSPLPFPTSPLHFPPPGHPPPVLQGSGGHAGVLSAAVPVAPFRLHPRQHGAPCLSRHLRLHPLYNLVNYSHNWVCANGAAMP